LKSIIKKLLKNIKKNKTNAIVVSGGETLKKTYNLFFREILKKKIKLKIFLSDERCLPLNDKNTNEIFFKKFKYINFQSILKKKFSYKKTSDMYEKKITKTPNFVLLSVGSDGHIASIFKSSKALKSRKNIIFLNKNYRGFKRISITLKYLKNKKIYLFCKTRKRYNIFTRNMNQKDQVVYNLLKINPNVNLIYNNRIFKVKNKI